VENTAVAIWIVILAIIALILLDYTRGFRVYVQARADGENDPIIIFHALDPLIKAAVTLEEGMPIATVSLFRLQILRSPLQFSGEKGGGISVKRLLQNAALSDVRVSSTYSMENPGWTGILSPWIAMLIRNITSNRESGQISIRPDFSSISDSFRLDADADFSLGHTMINYMKRST